jgi:uncharacterized membrane protein
MKRLPQIDVVRGLAMVVMALDHVRDFFHITAQTANPLDLNTTTPFLFFTRWITHFCAPTFLFLSGVSAFLSGRSKALPIVSRFLILRGLWIVLVDFMVISLALTFNPNYNLVMLTVLWAIGCSMMLLGLILRISPKLVLPLGLLLFLTHDYIGLHTAAATGPFSGLSKVLFNGIYVAPVGADHAIAFLYAVLPWAAVVFLGYGTGRWIQDRKKVVFAGVALLALFLVLRALNQYGDPQPWSRQPTVLWSLLSFVNTTKYPPSLQFLSMTLSASLLFMAAVWTRQNWFQRFTTVYGRVPFFYYVLHLILAHLFVVLAFYATGHTNAQIIDPKSPFWFRPQVFGFSLPVTYLVWLTVVLLLYYPCRWFDRYKRTHQQWWLRYL